MINKNSSETDSERGLLDVLQFFIILYHLKALYSM